MISYWIVVAVNFVRLALVVILGATAVVAISVVLVFGARGWRLLSVQTGSMVPTFRPGDAVLRRPITNHKLRVGEVVSYLRPDNSQVLITHRLVAVNKQTGWLTTQGDSLTTPDPSFPARLVTGEDVAVAPHFGHVLDVARRPLGLAILVYIPAAALAYIETKRLADSFKRPSYRLQRRAR